MSIPLTEIVKITHSFNDGAVHWSKFSWIYNNLPWTIRVLARCHIAKNWWKEKYVLPILQEAATPHLERYAQGLWRQFEEEKLKTLFFFFQPKKNSFSQALCSFLSSSPPSFVTEKNYFQQQAPKTYGTLNWYRDETFSHYKDRISTLLRRQPVSGSQPQKKEVPEPPTDLVKPYTQKAAVILVEELLSLRQNIIELCENLKQELASAFPLRMEIEETITSLTVISEKAWSLLTQVDKLLSTIPEHGSLGMTESSLRETIHLTNAVKKEIHNSFNELKSLMQRLQPQIQTARSYLLQQLHLLSRSIDKTLLLPACSQLRPQETRLLKVAREKVKRFRTCLSKGPGPQICLRTLQDEISVLLELASSFYEEGRAIESMREQIRRLQTQVNAARSTETNVEKAKRLQGLSAEIAHLLDTLDITADRKHRFDKIVHALSEVNLGT